MASGFKGLFQHLTGKKAFAGQNPTFYHPPRSQLDLEEAHSSGIHHLIHRNEFSTYSLAAFQPEVLT